jgi:hypothetical protein
VACSRHIGIALQGRDAHGQSILYNSAARQDRGRTDKSFGLSKAVTAIFGGVKNFRHRITAIELT